MDTGYAVIINGRRHSSFDRKDWAVESATDLVSKLHENSSEPTCCIQVIYIPTGWKVFQKTINTFGIGGKVDRYAFGETV